MPSAERFVPIGARHRTSNPRAELVAVVLIKGAKVEMRYPRYRGVISMGDKSPKNTSKAKKQKAEQKSAKRTDRQPVAIGEPKPM